MKRDAIDEILLLPNPMSNWYYFNEKDEKVGPVSSTVLKELARQGLITKETKIVNNNGRSAVAGQVNGLTFVEAKKSGQPQPFESAGFDFPALVSEGNTPNDFDPFANTAPHQVPIPFATSKPLSTFAKPIVLVPVSVGSGMLLMLLMMLVIMTIFGNTKDKTQVGRSDVSNVKIEANEPSAKEVEKPKQKQQSTGLLLKPPHPKEEFIRAATVKIEKLVKDEFKPATYGDHLIVPYIRVMESSWDTTNNVYALCNKIKNEKELLPKIEALKNGYAICMANIATQWHYGIQAQTYVFNADMAITQATGMYETNGAYHNLEQIMTTITARVKTLNKEKYANTIKLYSLLSKYQKSTTAPSGSLKSYSENIAAYQEEFTQTMSLAELEW